MTSGPFLKLYTSYIREFENMTSCFDDARRKYPEFEKVCADFEVSGKHTYPPNTKARNKGQVRQNKLNFQIADFQYSRAFEKCFRISQVGISRAEIELKAPKLEQIDLLSSGCIVSLFSM